MNNYEYIYKVLISRISSTRRKENLIGLSSSLLNSLTIFIWTLISVGALEMIFNGDITFRTILAVSVLIIFATALGLLVIPKFLKLLGLLNSYDDNYMAIRIGNLFVDVKDNLCNALQLVQLSKNPNGTSSELALSAFSEIASKVNTKNFDAILDYNQLKKSLIYFLTTLIFLSIFNFVIFPNSFGYSLERIVNYNRSYLPTVPYSLSIEPYEQTILRGEAVIITITASGVAPQEVSLYIKEDKQELFDKIQLKLIEGNSYIYEIQSLKNSITYYAETEWFGEKIKTSICKVYVIDKPIIKNISGKLVFPTYTKQETSYFNEQNSDFTALVGSNAIFRVSSNKELMSAKIIFVKKDMTDKTEEINLKNDTSTFNLNISGKQADGSFRIARSGNYYFELTDLDGEKSENPILYSVIAVQDAYPTIKLVSPANDVEINTNAMLPIKISVNDDFGISKINLFYRLAKSPYAVPDEKFSTTEIKFSTNESSFELSYLWDLNKLGIMPDDVFEFYLEVSDNDVVNGPKKSKTQTLSVRLPSLSEVQKESDQVQNKIEKDLEKLIKEATEVKKDIEELGRELQKEKNKFNEPDWKQKKKAEEILNRQEDLKEKMTDMAKTLEQATEKLQENQMISPETLQKYQELQNLMKQVDSPELRQMQQKMQDALKNMNQEQLQKAMEQFKFNDEQFRKSIERSMKILKRLQAEQKTDALRKRAEELAKQQDELAEETQKTSAANKEKQNELAKRQEKIQKELNNIEKELKDLEKLMQEIGENEMPMDNLKDAMENLKPDETNKEMENSQQNMQSGQMEKSSQNQKKASKNLKDFASKMQQMKQNMQQQNTQEAIEKMEKFASDVLDLSKKQENVKNNTAKADYNSTKLPQFAQDQAEMFESLMNVAQAMSALSEKSFAVTPEMANEISNALKEMRKSVENMADRNNQKAAQSQSAAMGALNRAASQMQDMAAAMKAQQSGSCDNPGGMGGGSGSGMTPGMSMSQKMQEIAAQQQAINQALQQMMQGGKGTGGQMSMEQQAEMGRLADKQGGAKKSLDELLKEQKEFGNDSKKLGELEKLAKEMQEVMTDMKQNGVRPEQMRKQERILSKLLDISRSVYDRDYEEQREGNQADNLFKNSPGDLDLLNQEGRDKVIKDLIKSNQRGYSKDYENLIKTYFESLQNIQRK